MRTRTVLTGDSAQMLRNTALLVEEDGKFFMPYDTIEINLPKRRVSFSHGGKEIVYLELEHSIDPYDTLTLSDLKGLTEITMEST